MMIRIPHPEAGDIGREDELEEGELIPMPDTVPVVEPMPVPVPVEVPA
jgi:hypothetical protein